MVGVIPQSLMQRELGHTGLTELHVVQTMHERKRLMAERSDAFLALPGGIGTLEELFEVWTWRQLGYHDKPVGLLNTEGYYDKLLAFVADMAEHGFVPSAQRELLQVDDRTHCRCCSAWASWPSAPPRRTTIRAPEVARPRPRRFRRCGCAPPAPPA